MFRTLKSFGRDRSGNFGLMVAVMTVPLIGGIGLAVDYAQGSTARAELQSAADAAAVGAIAETSPAVKAALTMAGDGPIAVGTTDAVNLFRANLIGRKMVDIDAADVEAEVRKVGKNVTAKITYKTTVPTHFMGLLGQPRIELAGTAAATNVTAPLIDFFLLLDNTPSMGVGATPADVDKLVANTGDKCAFACHDLSNSNNYYQLAKKLGVTTRIDVVRQATQNLMDTAAATRRYADQYRMAVYTFGEAATDTKLQKVMPLTDNLGEAKKAAAVIDLMTIPYQNYNNDQQTDFDNTFDKIKKEVAAAKTESRRKIVFFVSDGVADAYKPAKCKKKTTGGRCQEPIDLSICESLKAEGAEIAVLYTTYLPLPTNGWYNSWIKPFQGEISPSMKSCATPGLFFEVSPTEGISDAMKALFFKVINKPRLAS